MVSFDITEQVTYVVNDKSYSTMKEAKLRQIDLRIFDLLGVEEWKIPSTWREELAVYMTQVAALTTPELPAICEERFQSGALDNATYWAVTWDGLCRQVDYLIKDDLRLHAIKLVHACMSPTPSIHAARDWVDARRNNGHT